MPTVCLPAERVAAPLHCASRRSRRLVAQLLALMDGFEPADNVIVIGATNRPDDIDPCEGSFASPDRVPGRRGSIQPTCGVRRTHPPLAGAARRLLGATRSRSILAATTAELPVDLRRSRSAGSAVFRLTPDAAIDRWLHIGCVHCYFRRWRVAQGANPRRTAEPSNAPDRIRTCDLRFRRLPLDPAGFRFAMRNTPAPSHRCSANVAMGRVSAGLGRIVSPGRIAFVPLCAATFHLRDLDGRALLLFAQGRSERDADFRSSVSSRASAWPERLGRPHPWESGCGVP
jgi:ATPase family associated with various cellular activities (AAA)